MDPGFPVGVGANIRFCQNVQKKLHEIEIILGRKGVGGAPRSANEGIQ